jgi:hypothetical protein
MDFEPNWTVPKIILILSDPNMFVNADMICCWCNINQQKKTFVQPYVYITMHSAKIQKLFVTVDLYFLNLSNFLNIYKLRYFNDFNLHFVHKTLKVIL